MRVLGDEYVKGEFRAHREVENPMHIVSSWRFSLVLGRCSFLVWGMDGEKGKQRRWK
jgi:hypothetical protein